MNALETQNEISVAFFLYSSIYWNSKQGWTATMEYFKEEGSLKTGFSKSFMNQGRVWDHLWRHELWQVLCFGVVFLTELKVHELYLDLPPSFVLHGSKVVHSTFQSYRKLSSTSSEESMPISSIMSISSMVSSSRFTNVELLDPVSMALSSDVWELRKNTKGKKS